MYVSARRTLIDAFLRRIVPELQGKAILDVGGARRRRGSFQIGEARARRWEIVNRDAAAEPDLQAEFPPLPYGDAEFDFVVCTEVLEYAARPDELVREMLRVAREKVVLTVPFLSAVHGDAEFDFLRFTPAYFHRLARETGASCRVEAMGGLFAVLCDLLAARGGWIRRLGRLGGRFVGPGFGRGPAAIATGYWVELTPGNRKPE